MGCWTNRRVLWESKEGGLMAEFINNIITLATNILIIAASISFAVGVLICAVRIAKYILED